MVNIAESRFIIIFIIVLVSQDMTQVFMFSVKNLKQVFFLYQNCLTVKVFTVKIALLQDFQRNTRKSYKEHLKYKLQNQYKNNFTNVFVHKIENVNKYIKDLLLTLCSQTTLQAGGLASTLHPKQTSSPSSMSLGFILAPRWIVASGMSVYKTHELQPCISHPSFKFK